mmetsp:Transcript_13769/g.25977  ORF Transcript_13769/g.25977 Transcript_13769/m.25977 type:complete len:132 (+) Transcript_13769:1529-1924(+)
MTTRFSEESLFTLLSSLLGSIFGLLGLVRSLMKMSERQSVAYALYLTKMDYMRKRVAARRSLIAMLRVKQAESCLCKLEKGVNCNSLNCLVRNSLKDSPTEEIDSSLIYSDCINYEGKGLTSVRPSHDSQY